MRFDRSWCEDIGSEDLNGRGRWALSQTVEFTRNPDLRWWTMHWFDQVAVPLSNLSAPRAVAYSMLDASSMLRSVDRYRKVEEILEGGGDLAPPPRPPTDNPRLDALTIGLKQRE
jgi:hypothetical protein